MSQNKMISNNFHESCDQGVVVIKQPPMKRMVKFSLREKRRRGLFFLSLPLIYFRLHYKKRINFFAKDLHMVFVDNDKLFCPVLPNISQGANVCIKLPKKGYSSLEELYNRVIEIFWQSEFNGTMPYSSESMYKNSLLYDYTTWQDKTKSEPNWHPSEKELNLCRNITNNFFYGKILR